MADITDYVAWRGDLSFEQSPWNDVDALIFASLSYLSFQGTENARGVTLAQAKERELLLPMEHPLFGVRKAMFEAMADSVRFRDCRMHHFIAVTNAEKRMQFSAVCCDLPDGTLCVAFRGTDATLVGWREDMDMSLLEPVPAQEAAVYYLQRAMELDGRSVRVVGHSKGGNLAAYACAKAEPALQERLMGIWSFDGPGMAPDVFESEGYRRIRPGIHSLVPQTSIVGMMMCYHEPYTVVHAMAEGMQQHNPHTWQVRGPGFEVLEEIDDNARIISETLHEFLQQSDKEQRAAFLDAAFRMIESTGATSLGEIREDKLKSLWNAFTSGKELKPETRKQFNKVVGLFVSLGVGNVIERYRNRKSERAAERELEAMEKEQLAKPAPVKGLPPAEKILPEGESPVEKAPAEGESPEEKTEGD